MEILPGVFRVASFMVSIQDWMNMQPCLNKVGYRYQITKKEDRENIILITVLQVKEYAPDDTKEFINDSI